VLVIAVLMGVSLLGLGVGKWVNNNIAGVMTLATLGLLIALPFVNTLRGAPPPNRGFELALPHFSVFQLSVFSKMTFGALCGFEYVAIFAGECRNPRKNIARSMMFTAPIIAAVYILGTGTILSYVRPDNIDVIGPIPQALSIGFNSLGFLRQIAPLAILLLLCNYLATYSLTFSANARLPMVAGWDRLLPQWFTRLHPKYRTPVNSIVFAGALTAGVALGVLAGVGQKEAFEILQVGSFTCYGLAYLVMFALPLFGFRGEKISSPLWLRAAAVSGFLVTLVFVALSIFPFIEVRDRAAYIMKIGGVVLGANLLGACILLLEKRAARART
jgi:amino acid transporter